MLNFILLSFGQASLICDKPLEPESFTAYFTKANKNGRQYESSVGIHYCSGFNPFISNYHKFIDISHLLDSTLHLASNVSAEVAFLHPV